MASAAILSAAGTHLGNSLHTPRENRVSPASLEPQLYGNDGQLQRVRILSPCSPDMPVSELRKKYLEDGVIWMKGLLDPEKVNEFRGEYLTYINEGSIEEGTQMLKPGTDPRDGIFNSAAEPQKFLLGGVRVAAGIPNEGPFVDRAHKSHSWNRYKEFKDNIGRQLEPFVGQLGEFDDPWCLPRSLLRFAVPGSNGTPVHYDHIYLRAGPPTFVTAWVPLGDVEVEGGGLIYLDRSNDIGIEYENEFSEKSRSFSEAERISAFNKNMMTGGWLDQNAARFGEDYKRCWLVGPYEAGDVLFHTPHAIHAGAQNRSPEGRIRLATDLRFVDKTKPYDERWTKIAFSESDGVVAK